MNYGLTHVSVGCAGLFNIARMLRKILVALDGSRYSDAALEFAIELARPFAATLLLQHVMPPSLSAAAVEQLARIEALPPELRERNTSDRDLLAAAGQEILAAAEQQATAMGVKRVLSRLDEGEPADEILAYAARAAVDLIVVGSHGLGLLREALIGSVSNRLLHSSPCPCCMVVWVSYYSSF